MKLVKTMLFELSQKISDFFRVLSVNFGGHFQKHILVEVDAVRGSIFARKLKANKNILAVIVGRHGYGPNARYSILVRYDDFSIGHDAETPEEIFAVKSWIGEF